jgi:peptidylprolyl isomerase
MDCLRVQNYENVAQTYGNLIQATGSKWIPTHSIQSGKKKMALVSFEGLGKPYFGDMNTTICTLSASMAQVVPGDVIPPNTNIVFEIKLLETAPQY